MDYEYEFEEPYGARILWGRIAVFAMALLLMLLFGMWIGGRGTVSEGEVARLQEQVRELANENERLEQRIAAQGAVEDDRPRVGDEEDQDEAPVAEEGEGEEADEDPGGEPTDADGTQTYVVESGDNLYGIALRMYGDGSKFRLIADANNIDQTNRLTVGQELIIPPDEDDEA